MAKMTKDELQVRNREIQDRMAEMNDKAYKEKREFTEEEQREWNALTREKTMNLDQLREMATDAELAKMREAEDKNAKLRELLKDNGQKREIVLTNDGSATNPVGVYSNSGAINLTIHELIPTLHEGLDLPSTLRVVTGVTGNEIWPVNVDDVEMEEVGEVVALNDHVVDFAKINVQSNRVGCSIPISRHAIANAAFDVVAFIQEKVTLATRIYLAEKVYTPASGLTGNVGPFAGQTPKTIVLDEHAYANILEAVAEFSDQGFFEGNVCISMSRKTEAYLKALPKIPGAAAGFVIENGLCAGYPYTLSHYVNSKNDNNVIVPDADNEYFEIGYWELFALQSHDTPSLIIDATSSDVAMKNIIRVIFNSFWSMTDLSTHINGGKPVSDGHGGYTYPTQAFALYEVAEAESSSEI